MAPNDPVRIISWKQALEEMALNGWTLPTNAVVTINPGDIEIGAVELKNATNDDRAKIAAATAISGSDFAVAVQAAILGVLNGAAVVTDADGTIQQYLRGVVKLIAAGIGVTVSNPFGGAVTSVDGGLVTVGQKNGAAVVTDADGSLQQYLRGLVKLWISGIYCGTGLVSQTNPLPVSQTRVSGAAADVNVPAVNTAAVVTYAADATKKHIITGVAWSYSGGIPVGGRLTIADNGVTIFDLDITDSGCGSFEFPRPKIQAAANTALVITLAAGGATIYSKLSVENHWLE